MKCSEDSKHNNFLYLFNKMNASGEQQRWEWVEIIEPRSKNIMYVNLTSGDCLWEPPQDVLVKKMDWNQWWELYDTKTTRYYYYNPISLLTVWQKPLNADIIPLAKLQNLRQHTEVAAGAPCLPSIGTTVDLNNRCSTSPLVNGAVRKEIATQTPPPAAAHIMADSESSDWRRCSSSDRQRGHRSSSHRRRHQNDNTTTVSVSSTARSRDRDTITSVCVGTEVGGNVVAGTGDSPVQRCPSQQSVQSSSWSSGTSTLNRSGGPGPRATGGYVDRADICRYLDDVCAVSEGSLDSGIPDNNSWDSLDSSNPSDSYYSRTSASGPPSTANTLIGTPASSTGTPHVRHRPFPRTNPAYMRPRLGSTATANSTSAYGIPLATQTNPSPQSHASTFDYTNNVSPAGSSRSSAATDDTLSIAVGAPLVESTAPMYGGGNRGVHSASSNAFVDNAASLSLTCGAAILPNACAVSSACTSLAPATVGAASTVVCAPKHASIPSVPNIATTIAISAGGIVGGSCAALKRQGSEPGPGLNSPYLNRPQSMLVALTSHGQSSSLPPGSSLTQHMSSDSFVGCARSTSGQFQAGDMAVSGTEHTFGPSSSWAVNLFRKEVLKDGSRLNFTKESISKPLLQMTDKTLKKEACDLFKHIQMYMNDRKCKLSASEVAFVVVNKGWRIQGLRDELFMQICKQMTNNFDATSLQLGWELLCVALSFFPPSSTFHPYLESYMMRHNEDLYSLGCLSRYPQLALRRLHRIALSGARRGIQPPSIEEICLAKMSILSPSIFGSSLDEVMTLQRDRFPAKQLPWIQEVLSEEVLRLNGARTEGIFRVPGDIDAVNQLKVRCENWESPSSSNGRSGCEDPHVPASLLKLWYRELADPLIPHDCYARALACHDNPVDAAAVVRDLPALNRLCLTYLVRFLQVFAASESASVTKMDVNNLAMVMAPNILRCISLEPTVIFENTRREMSYLRTLILHLDTSELNNIL